MPVTLANLRRQVISRVQAEHVKSSDLFPADLLDVWLSEAYIELQRRLRLVTAQQTQELTADTARFTRPSDILDQMVFGKHAIRVKDSEGVITNLSERTWQFMRERYGDFSNPNDNHGSVDWCWDADDFDKIVVQWPAEQTVANGLIIDYVPDPGDLAGGYDPDSATCSVSNGSATVTFASSISGRVAAGDGFGVKSAADELPSTFYVVQSVDSTTQITLASNYSGAADSSALFTLSPISLIERKRPGLVRYAPVEYALYRARQLHEGDQTAATAFQAWEAEIARIRRQIGHRPGLEFEGVQATHRHPALSSHRRNRR